MEFELQQINLQVRHSDAFEQNSAFASKAEIAVYAGVADQRAMYPEEK